MRDFLAKYKGVLAALFIAAGVVAEFAFFVLFRRVNLDEGWYLWASKLVYEGKLLYWDFAYTQTPLLPYVYGLFLRSFGEGLYQGRILSAILGASSGLICCWIVWRHLQSVRDGGGRVSLLFAPLFCAALFATSFYTICYYVYSATYSLAAFFLIAAVGALHLFPLNNRSAAQELFSMVLATMLISCAIATRMSAVGALPALMLYIVLVYRARVSFVRTVFVVGIIGIVSALVLLGPFWFTTDERMFYNIFGFHTDRIPSITRQWYRQLTTLRRSAWIYAVPLLVATVSLLLGVFAKYRPRSLTDQEGTIAVSYFGGDEGGQPWWQRNGLALALCGMIVGPLLVHLVPRTTDAYYNALQFPLLCVLAGVCVARLHGLSANLLRPQQWRLVMVGLLTLNGLIHVGAVTYFSLVAWDDGPLPRNQVETVREAADFLRGIEKTDNQLLTLNTHLALEAGMDVPRGYEMSIFSYRPDWNELEAWRFHVVNNEILIMDLEAGADAVAITDFDAERFYGKRQQIFDALTQNYRHAKTVAGFDPQYNDLAIYLPPQFGAVEPHYPLVANFDHAVDLLGYDLPKLRYKAGEVVDIALYWQTQDRVDLPYTVFVQIVDPYSALAVGWDNPPCQRTCPTQSWRSGEVLRDEYRLPLPTTSLVAGRYLVQMGLYHSDTGEPLQLASFSPSLDPQRVDENQILKFVDGRLQLTWIEIE